MVVAGEAAPPAVHEPGPFPPQSLRQQEAALPRDVQGRRVKLDVLHAGQDGAGPQRHRVARAPGAGRVGGVRVEVAEPARGEDGGGGADGFQAVGGVVAGAGRAVRDNRGVLHAFELYKHVAACRWVGCVVKGDRD